MATGLAAAEASVRAAAADGPARWPRRFICPRIYRQEDTRWPSVSLVKTIPSLSFNSTSKVETRKAGIR